MLYVQQSLTQNEQLIHIGVFHWMYDVKACLSIVFGLLLAILIVVISYMLQTRFGVPLAKTYSGSGWLEFVRALHPGIKMMAFITFLFGLLRYAQMMVYKVTTEIVITTHRLIFKRGLISRFVGEMSINRIESVNVLQTFWGRILNYGQIIAHGIGVGEVVLPPITDPLSFRRAIEKARQMQIAIDKSAKSNAGDPY